MFFTSLPDSGRILWSRGAVIDAVVLNVILVTNNERDFLEYPGLRLESWVAEHEDEE